MHYTLTDMILDLIQNSIEAESTIITLIANKMPDHLTVRLIDNGKGMTEGELVRAKDPFYTDGFKHKKRRVGLGIPFLMQTVDQTDGFFNLQSEKNKGTSLDIDFNLKHWDTPPEGDWVSLILQSFCFEGDYELRITRNITRENDLKQSYTISRHELIDVLGDLNSGQSMILLRDFIQSQEDDIKET